MKASFFSTTSMQSVARGAFRRIAIVAALTFLVTGLTRPAPAQVIRQNWIDRMDDYSGLGWKSGMVKDPDGNLIVCAGLGDGNDFQLVKYSPDGIRLWTRAVTVAGGYFEQPYLSSIAVGPDGGVVVCGEIGYLIGNISSFAFKCDRDGNELWDKVFTNRSWDTVFFSAAVDSSGNIAITGYGDGPGGLLVKLAADGTLIWEQHQGFFFFKAAIDAGGSIYAAGQTDTGIGLVKCDSGGNVVWSRDLPNHSGNVGSADLAIDAAGNIVITGGAPCPNGAFGYVMAKYDPFGNKLWDNSYVNPLGDGYDLPSAVAVDAQGNTYVTGISSADSENAETVTLKLDSAGSLVWERHYGPAIFPGFMDIHPQMIVDPSGGILVATTVYTGQGFDVDVVVLKYDASGNALWSKTFSGPIGQIDLSQALIPDGSGSYYLNFSTLEDVLGNSFRTVKFGPNKAPALSVPSTAAVNVGCPISVQASATDPENDAVTFSLVGAPSWASINASTGQIALNPPAGTVGTFSVAVKATDSYGAYDQKSISVTVCPIAIENVTLSKKNGITTVQFNVRNTDGTIVNTVSLNSSSLKGTATMSAMPIAFTQLKQGVVKQVQLKFNNVPSGPAQFIVNGTSSAGPVNANMTVNVP